MGWHPICAAFGSECTRRACTHGCFAASTDRPRRDSELVTKLAPFRRCEGLTAQLFYAWRYKDSSETQHIRFSFSNSLKRKYVFHISIILVSIFTVTEQTIFDFFWSFFPYIYTLEVRLYKLSSNVIKCIFIKVVKALTLCPLSSFIVQAPFCLHGFFSTTWNKPQGAADPWVQFDEDALDRHIEQMGGDQKGIKTSNRKQPGGPKLVLQLATKLSHNNNNNNSSINHHPPQCHSLK